MLIVAVIVAIVAIVWRESRPSIIIITVYVPGEIHSNKTQKYFFWNEHNIDTKPKKKKWNNKKKDTDLSAL